MEQLQKEKGAVGNGGGETQKTHTLRVVLVILFTASMLLFTYVFAWRPDMLEIERTLQFESLLRPIGESGASLGLLSSDGTREFSVEDEFGVLVFLETAEAVSGVDVVVVYDPRLLEVVTGSRGEPVLGTDNSVFALFPHSEVIEGDSEARVRFSAIASFGETFAGEGVVAEVIMRARKKGNTTVTLEYNGGGDSRDSNVAREGRDILGSVRNIDISIL